MNTDLAIKARHCLPKRALPSAPARVRAGYAVREFASPLRADPYRLYLENMTRAEPSVSFHSVDEHARHAQWERVRRVAQHGTAWLAVVPATLSIPVVMTVEGWLRYRMLSRDMHNEFDARQALCPDDTLRTLRFDPMQLRTKRFHAELAHAASMQRTLWISRNFGVRPLEWARNYGAQMSITDWMESFRARALDRAGSLAERLDNAPAAVECWLDAAALFLRYGPREVAHKVATKALRVGAQLLADDADNDSAPLYTAMSAERAIDLWMVSAVHVDATTLAAAGRAYQRVVHRYERKVTPAIGSLLVNALQKLHATNDALVNARSVMDDVATVG